MTRLSLTFLYIFFYHYLILILACRSDKTPVPDVSHIAESLEILRFEKDFYKEADPDLNILSAKYPLFWEIYFGHIMAEFSQNDSFTDQDILDLHQNLYLKKLLDSVHAQFEDFSPWEKDIRSALRRYIYYFEDPSPKVLVTFISEYGIGACTFGDDTLGVGLDMFLGEEFSGYDPHVFPAFIRQQMTKDHLSTQVIKAFVQNLVPPPNNNRMLDYMLYYGKILFVLDLLFPEKPDFIKMEYKPEQMDWVKENEVRIWNHFISRELLYSTRKQDFQKLIGPSPNAPNMPPEAPGQTANFIGWQIIKSFVKRNPEIQLKELLSIDDSQKILEMAKYRPK